jgi:hypothetical protein
VAPGLLRLPNMSDAKRGSNPFSSEEEAEIPSSTPLGELENQRDVCIQRAWETYRLCVAVATDRSGGRAPAVRGQPFSRSPEAATGGPGRVIAWLWDAAQIAHFTAEMLLRRSDFALVAASTCAEICDWVADELEALSDDGSLLACGEACRLLADECDRLADEPESLAA